MIIIDTDKYSLNYLPSRQMAVLNRKGGDFRPLTLTDFGTQLADEARAGKVSLRLDFPLKAEIYTTWDKMRFRLDNGEKYEALDAISVFAHEADRRDNLPRFSLVPLMSPESYTTSGYFMRLTYPGEQVRERLYKTASVDIMKTAGYCTLHYATRIVGLYAVG